MNKTVRYWVQVKQDGFIDVPADIPEDEVEYYIGKNFDDIKFEKPDLNYGDTEFEFGRE